MRRRRILAFLLDFCACAALADAAGLALTALVWSALPSWRGLIPWIWAAVALAAVVGFLLRDARGGRARRLLALAALGPDDRPPGAVASVARNLVLLIPLWNLLEAWPVLKDGSAQRPADRRRQIRVVQTS